MPKLLADLDDAENTITNSDKTKVKMLPLHLRLESIYIREIK